MIVPPLRFNSYKKRFYFFFGLFWWCINEHIEAQQIPVSFPLLNEYLRRKQVLGELDPDFSFHYLPINPKKAFGIEGAFKPDSLLFSDAGPTSTSKVKFQFLPLQLTQVYNSTIPYGWGDGAIIPSRGLQPLFSAGVYASYGPLSIQLYPQYHYAQNKPFEEYSSDLPFRFHRRNVYFLERLDLPVRHGNRPIRQFLPGNSSVRLNFGAFSAGISTENIWWGPGQYQALLLSDNAEGFLHATFNTTKPAKTFLGNFEGQYFMGKLDESGLSHYSDGAYEEYILPYPEDWRYITGISISYSPKWVEGLFLGFSRSFMMYSTNVKKGGFNAWFPLLEPFQKEQVGLIESHESETDQHMSVLARWVLPDIKSEFYVEYMRTDHALNWRELLLNPEHSRGYIMGFSKYLPLPGEQVIHINLEMTQTESSINNLVKWGEIYEEFHSGLGLYENFQVRHGLTHKGQILGSGLGHSGNLAKIEISKIKGMNKIGLTLERFARDQNIHNFAKANKVEVLRWVDLGVGGLMDHQYQNLLFSFQAMAIRSHNYNWAVKESNILGNMGENKFNFYSKMKLAYLF